MTALHNCLAPAKLNLFLHVTGRRADGFHLLQTVFQLLDYGDLLHFETREDGIIRRTTEVQGIPEDADLIVRAARLLQQALGDKGLSKGINISIEKRLPMGGGLGGGSSDAATTLIALNHLWRAGLNRAQLMELSLRLGADVPFFILGSNAFAEGVGEILTPLDTPHGWFVVIEPGVIVPTPLIFSSPDLTRNTKPITISDFSAAPLGFGKNDLQVVAAKLFPPVAQAIEWLNQYGEARMTGSGACVFCRFDHEPEADKALKAVPAHWQAWKARALARHPLADL
ncbi:MAG: 4-(cytidine 5'-diphospho)-2-C-methyl-D-erythritol kinase [Burkholderiales bacterium]|nr:4-(cytidine 5'-diphospho)-2-C-methyl-D-erythritol kinase [Burkholderiales bacterium]